MSACAVAARGLEKRFGRARALAGIDLDVPEACCLAVLGPNGAGKSTLLRLVAGLGRPTSGELRVAGEPAGGRAARGRVGLVADATFLYPELTALENLIFAGRLHGVRDPRARAERLLADEDLSAVAGRRVGGFSRGMAQRLSIARGLIHDPPVVLLDEPFSGLDRAGAERLAGRLAALRRDGRTLLLVTHDFGRAAELADRTVLLSGGRIVHASGPGDAEALERAYAALPAAS